MRLPNNLGMLLLGIWLIAWGLVALIPALNGLGRLRPDLPLALRVQCLCVSRRTCSSCRVDRRWGERKAKPLVEPVESYSDAIIDTLAGKKIKL